MLEENGETQNLDKAKKEAEAQSNAEDSTSDAPVTQAEQVSETADASTAAPAIEAAFGLLAETAVARAAEKSRLVVRRVFPQRGRN